MLEVLKCDTTLVSLQGRVGRVLEGFRSFLKVQEGQEGKKKVQEGSIINSAGRFSKVL